MFKNAFILVFHQTSNRYYPGINNIRPKDFWALFSLIREWGYAFHHQDSAGDQFRKSVIVSFDDGYRDNYDILMDLADRDIKTMVFVPGAFVGKSNHWEYSSRFFTASHLDKNEIKKLARAGIIFGAHGLTHRALTGLALRDVKLELIESRQRLEDITVNPIEYISFPFGRISPRVIETSLECGYRAGFVMDMDISRDDSFLFRRTPVYGSDSIYSLKARLEDNPLEKLKSRVINRLSSGTIILSEVLK